MDCFESMKSKETRLYLVCREDKYGYIDKTGREVIPCKYDDANDFREGLAKVQKSGKYGFIDKTGREVIPCKYDEAYATSEGQALAKKSGKWGAIDKTGREVVPFIFDDASLKMILESSKVWQ